eukprot:XP_014031402.1 PREDICTED: transcription factor SOX-6-like isoform X1 [Salmo salar]
MPSSAEVVSLGSGGAGPVAEGAIGGDERLSFRIMSSKQATSPFASVADGEEAMSQDHLSWDKEESAEAHGTPQLPLHSLLHSKGSMDELQPLSSVPPESDWDSMVSAQQRMVRDTTL